MKLRWFELRPLLKAVLVTGVTVGGLGLFGGLGFSVQAILAGRATFSLAAFSLADSGLYIILFLVTLLLTPLLSSVCLLFLPLTEERRDILGFVSLIASITALPVVYFLLFFLYCSATHSSCS